MALTNDFELMAKMARLRSHGITREVDEMTHDPDGPWYYQQLELGYNYRMTDIQAALGVSQFKKLGDFIGERHKVAARYNQLLAEMPVLLPWQSQDGYSAFHLYVVRLRQEDTASNSHKQVFESMRAAGIGVNLHYIPIYRQPYYAAIGFNPKDFPEAEQYYKEAITLPIYPGLSELQQHDVAQCLSAPIGYQTLF